MKNDKFSVVMNVVICTMLDKSIKVVVKKRKEAPYVGKLELPGEYMRLDESLKDASKRIVKELTGVKNAYIQQMHTFGEVKRDPRERTISITYLALIPASKLLDEDDELIVEDAQLVDMDELAGSKKMAFDHAKLVKKTQDWLCEKAQVSDVAFNILDEEFTLPDLQTAYELMLRKPLYKANFRKRVASLVEETDYMTVGAAHRPSRLYVKVQ